VWGHKIISPGKSNSKVEKKREEKNFKKSYKPMLGDEMTYREIRKNCNESETREIGLGQRGKTI